MKMNKTALMVAAAMGLSAAAQAELGANIGVTSNYLWRGVTQTDDGPAVQGGIDYSHQSGFYAGTWVSNIDWAAAGSGEEVDLYAGFAGEAGAFSYDVGVLGYFYPSHDDSDFVELYGSIGVGPVTAGINYTVSSDVDDASGSNEAFIEGDIYYYLSASHEVAESWTIGGTVGYYDFEDDGVAGGDTSYAHYQLDISKNAGDFGDFTLSVSRAEEEAGDDDAIVFVAWAKSF